MNFEGNLNGSWMPATQETPRQPEPAQATAPAKGTDDAGEKLAAEMKVFNAVAEELREALDVEANFEDRVQGVMKGAAELFGVAPTWTAFYREVLGASGLMRTLIGAGDELSAFECSSEHGQLFEMLTILRSRDLPENDPFEQQRMITVRIPKSLHDSICEEANQLSVSVNKLCITRMLQRVDKALIPSSTQKRRGRRPGATKQSPVSDDSSIEPTSLPGTQLPAATPATEPKPSRFDF